MDAFADTLIQLLIDWGYAGLFISALLAGSIIPFSSELVMLALVKVGLNLCLPAFRGRSHCHSIGIYAQQRHADHFFHVCGQTDTIYRHVIGLARGIVGDECLAVSD